MKISEEGKSLIKKFEGCELKAYKCAGNSFEEIEEKSSKLLAWTRY